MRKGPHLPHGHARDGIILEETRDRLKKLKSHRLKSHAGAQYRTALLLFFIIPFPKVSVKRHKTKTKTNPTMLPPKKFLKLKANLWDFMIQDVYPAETSFKSQGIAIGRQSNEWYDGTTMLILKEKAKRRGLWNLWLSSELSTVMGSSIAGQAGTSGAGLSNVQYAELCEIAGTSNHMELASHAMNCCSPDTGNMETIGRFGTLKQKEKWLKPLLDGSIRSAFAMTEPAVASSDASNIEMTISRDETTNEYVINGRKWWITGAGSLHCKVMIVMGKTNKHAARHLQQSMILIDLQNTAGITLLRPMQVLGDDDAPKGHMDVLFQNVRVGFENLLGEEGMGFEIAQARLGPGRLHHCMRLIGTAERSISLMCYRTDHRTAFKRKFSQIDTIIKDIALSRNEINMCRYLVLNAARMIDEKGSKESRKELSMCKSTVPLVVANIIDRAMQVHGAMGLSQDTFLATAANWSRWLRFADGPDEVH